MSTKTCGNPQKSGRYLFPAMHTESLPLATRRYIEESHVLGAEPPIVPKLGKSVGMTIEKAQKDEVQSELELPFFHHLKRTGKASAV